MKESIPERVIVFIIDGLHWRAPQLLQMPVFNELLVKGTFIMQSHMILPHHPTVGEYGRMHSSSFPNPVLQEGTLFIHPDNKMLQEVFPAGRETAFLANTKAYTSVTRGFDTVIQEPEFTDQDIVMAGINVIREQDPVYMRLHLQTAGNEGRYLSYGDPGETYYRNIYGPGSPYAAAVETADRLLGELINALEEMGKRSSTLLVITSDHGQSLQGWHPIIDEDSVITPMLFYGPSIAKGRSLSYFEHTDLSATIAGLMHLPQPNTDGGSGWFIREVLEEKSADGYTHPQFIRIINRQLNKYNALRARIMIAGEKDVYFSSLISYLENELLTPEPFYHQDRFLEWSRAGSTVHLIEANQKILQQIETELEKATSIDPNLFNPGY